MLAVVCFRWNGSREYRPEYVNALALGYKRHLAIPQPTLAQRGQELEVKHLQQNNNELLSKRT